MKGRESVKKQSVLPRMLRGSIRYFAACILAGIAFTICELVVPQIVRMTVDSVIGSKPLEAPGFVQSWILSMGGVAWLRQRLWLPAAVMAGFGLLSAGLRYVTNLYSSKAGETLVKTTRDLLYGHIQHLPWKWHMQNATGDIIQRCTSDVERVKTFFQEQFVSVFQIAVLIVLSLVCMIAMDWRLAMVPLVLFPVIVAYSMLFHNRIRDRFTDCDESEEIGRAHV